MKLVDDSTHREYLIILQSHVDRFVKEFECLVLGFAVIVSQTQITQECRLLCLVEVFPMTRQRGLKSCYSLVVSNRFKVRERER